MSWKAKTAGVMKRNSKTGPDLQRTVAYAGTPISAAVKLAYAGAYETRKSCVRHYRQNMTDRRLTYMRFHHRKDGRDLSGSMTFYARALETNPADILGTGPIWQALVEQVNTARCSELRAISCAWRGRDRGPSLLCAQLSLPVRHQLLKSHSTR